MSEPNEPKANNFVCISFARSNSKPKFLRVVHKREMNRYNLLVSRDEEEWRRARAGFLWRSRGQGGVAKALPVFFSGKSVA